MNDKIKIYLGLAIFLVVILFPAWYNFVNGKATYVPDLKIETKDVPGKETCVMEAEKMRTDHMDLLNDWRDIVVREGHRDYTAWNGRKYEMSLTRTCMDCHSDKENFCDKCHTYMSVSPYCWECHISPEDLEESLKVACDPATCSSASDDHGCMKEEAGEVDTHHTDTKKDDHMGGHAAKEAH